MAGATWRKGLSSLQLIPAAMLTIVALGAAVALQPLMPLASAAAWVAFFLLLTWTVWLLWKDRPSRRPR